MLESHVECCENVGEPRESAASYWIVGWAAAVGLDSPVECRGTGEEFCGILRDCWGVTWNAARVLQSRVECCGIVGESRECHIDDAESRGLHIHRQTSKSITMCFTGDVGAIVPLSLDNHRMTSSH